MAKTMTELTGGCQCGAVRYKLTSKVQDPHLCHCRMCQKAAGNYFMPLGGVKRDDFHITRGEASWFHSSGPVRRGFCSNCGTPLFFETVGHDGMAVTLGSLDDPNAVPPVSTYGSEAQYSWLGAICAQTGRETEESEELDGYSVKEIAATNHQHPDHDTKEWPQNS
ncbi:aldehyde-activating protein [Ahrensia marina]|uniref:Aldehyde-activating protein n=2 Tax=Ahrensia marina TaxID=1514904 RepID=A0A0N0E8I5_9HYPH|nr:aldehyde-activating protein [Ahrensia marina]